MATTLEIDIHGDPRPSQGPSFDQMTAHLFDLPPASQPSNVDDVDPPAYDYPDQTYEISQNEGWLLEYDELRMAQLEEAVRGLPLYAGLFAAVSSGFLLAGYSQLEPDYPEYIAKAMFEGQTNGTSGSNKKLHDPNLFAIPVIVKIAVALLVCSLLCAFGVAFGCLQARRWLDHHTRMIHPPVVVTRTWVDLRAAYTRDLAYWRFDVVIPLLHSGVNASLLLLLIGFATALAHYDLSLATLVIIAIAIIFSLYLYRFLRPLFRRGGGDDNPSSALELGQLPQTSPPATGNPTASAPQPSADNRQPPPSGPPTEILRQFADRHAMELDVSAKTASRDISKDARASKTYRPQGDRKVLKTWHQSWPALPYRVMFPDIKRSASSPLLDPVVSPHDLEEAPYSPPSVSPSLRKAPPYRSVMIHTERYAEYEKKFPPDMYGEAAAPGARVWKVYARDLDNDRLETWNDTLNILLLFAGLLSTACTAFMIDVYSKLQPERMASNAHSAVAFALLFNQSLPHSFMLLDLNEPGISTGVLWVNGLWFASLSLSLIVSLLAILARQWLSEYHYRMRAFPKSARHWAHVHRVHGDAFEIRRMDAVITTMPVLLHSALFLFIAGLGIILVQPDSASSTLTAVLSFVTAVLYVMATLMPLLYESCSLATPLQRMTKLAGSWLLSTHSVIRLWKWWTWLYARITASRNPNAGAPLPPVRPPLRREHSSAYPPPPIFDGSSFDIEEKRKDVGVLVRMICDLPDPRDVEVVMQTIAGLHPMVVYETIRNIHWLPERAAGMQYHVSSSKHLPMREIQTTALTLMRTLCALRVDSKSTMDHVHDIARSATSETRLDTFALLLVLKTSNGKGLSLPRLRRLKSSPVSHYAERNSDSYAWNAPPLLMPETACRLLIAFDPEVGRHQTSSSVMTLSQNFRASIREFDAWAAIIQQTVPLESDERENEQQVVSQVYQWTPENFQTLRYMASEDLNQVLEPFILSMGVRHFRLETIGGGTALILLVVMDAENRSETYPTPSCTE